MKYKNLLFITIYSIAFSGWAAVFISERIHPGWLFISLILMLYGFYCDIKAKYYLRPEWGSWLLFAGGGLAVFDWLFGSQFWFFSVVLLLLYITVVRALSPKANRDLAQMIALAFLELLAAATLTASISFAILFMVFFILTPWALLVVAGKAELEGEHDLLRGRVAESGQLTIPPQAERLFNRGIAFSLVTAMILTLMITAIFFAAFPRLSTGTFAGRFNLSQPMSGLSDQVELGDVGSILEDTSVALRVVFVDEVPKNVSQTYFRAIGLHSFDGRVWSNNAKKDHYYSENGHFVLDRVNLDDNSNVKLRQAKILTEDLGTNLLPVIPFVTDIYAPVQNVTQDIVYTVRHTRRNLGPLRYEITYLDGMYWRDLDWAQIPFPQKIPNWLRPATETPGDSLPDWIVQKIVELQEQDNLAWVQDVIDELRSFQYTLDTPIGENALDSFFARKAGHCELFATALALTLRAAGIPAIVVNGFRGGEWMPEGKYLLVRQRNAHSWVEAWLPEHGWVPLDPTPALDIAQPAFWQSTIQYWLDTTDQFRFWWLDQVVDYDLNDQKEAFASTQQKMKGFETQLKSWTKELREFTGTVGFGIVVILGIGIFGLGLYILIRILPGLEGAEHGTFFTYSKTPSYHKKLLKALQKKYGLKPEGIPLQTWLEKLKLDDGLYKQLSHYLRAYQKNRFKFLDPRKVIQLRDKAREITESLS